MNRFKCSEQNVKSLTTNLTTKPQQGQQQQDRQKPSWGTMNNESYVPLWSDISGPSYGIKYISSACVLDRPPPLATSWKNSFASSDQSITDITEGLWHSWLVTALKCKLNSTCPLVTEKLVVLAWKFMKVQMSLSSGLLPPEVIRRNLAYPTIPVLSQCCLCLLWKKMVQH